MAVHYVAEGDGEPAVIFLHGLGGFGESWRHNIPALARRAQVFALDLPGYGRSAKPRGPYDLGFFARVVHGFMATMGIGQASLVGHSLGGAVAVTCGLTHPSRIERLCLIGGLVPGFPYRASWIYRALARPGLGEVLALLGHARLYKAALTRCFHRPVAGEVDFLVDFAYGARTGPEARAAYLATLRHVGRDFTDRAEAYRRAITTLEAPVSADPRAGRSHRAPFPRGLGHGRLPPRHRAGGSRPAGTSPRSSAPPTSTDGWPPFSAAVPPPSETPGDRHG